MSEVEILRQKVKNQQAEIEWYQELYDRARAAQIQYAEEAERLRAENIELRTALMRPA